MSLIKLENVSKSFMQGSVKITAVNDVSLTVGEGELWVILGASGSGKSTLLQLMGGLDKPTDGKIQVDGLELTKAGDGQLSKLRREKIGFVFQNFNLIPTLNAVQNVEAAIAQRSKTDSKKAKDMLKLVELEQRANHLPTLLSGGEQQRVAIARSLINNPKIILADEPTGNLDSKTGTEIIEILHELNKEKKITIVLVTHSEYVKKYATHTAEMKDGTLEVLKAG